MLRKRPVMLLMALLALWGLIYSLGWQEHLSLQQLRVSRDAIQSSFNNNWSATLLFALAYIALTAISFPGATALTLFGGLALGAVKGTVVVLFCATAGAVGAFLLSRHMLSQGLRERYPDAFQRVDHGLRVDGAFYLFALRLNPVIPFFLINSLMGLTRMPLWTYTWISFVGMLPGSALYVNAGAQIASLETVSDILSTPFLLSSVALGLAPLAFRRLLQWLKLRS